MGRSCARLWRASYHRPPPPPASTASLHPKAPSTFVVSPSTPPHSPVRSTSSSASSSSSPPLPPLLSPPLPPQLSPPLSPPPSSRSSFPPSPTPHSSSPSRAHTRAGVDDAPSPPLSLHQIAQLRPRERVLVHPIEWTPLHLDLLHCSFAPAAPCQRRDGQPPSLPESRRATAAARSLAASETQSQQRRAVQSLLTSGRSPLADCRHGFRFRYTCRPLNSPMVSIGFCLRKTSNLGYRIPVAAWNSCGRLRDLRFQAMGLDKEKVRSNLPVWRMARLQFLDILPANPLRDPYTLGTLISIAQAQRAALSLSGQPAPPMLPVHVVCTDDNDPDNIHVLSAEIPTQLLDMLDNPTSPAPPLLPVSIRDITVPLEPPQMLQGRLLEIIVPE
ncbi:hypothetical protein C8A05DRAFT_14475 [Staphylotrichum tortipilum]|uniref:Uncharacterized protein n=1 Tax=Staphylotrichum tortipilum TaxID=2831512 RepID=A0AAN6RUK3_9PEZI|nr:hypothetical protein C8A05DRAFT_14475 [Staphylotrichum longicolle]